MSGKIPNTIWKPLSPNPLRGVEAPAVIIDEVPPIDPTGRVIVPPEILAAVPERPVPVGEVQPYHWLLWVPLNVDVKHRDFVDAKPYAPTPAGHALAQREGTALINAGYAKSYVLILNGKLTG